MLMLLLLLLLFVHSCVFLQFGSILTFVSGTPSHAISSIACR
jgi:hypothetical protein